MCQSDLQPGKRGRPGSAVLYLIASVLLACTAPAFAQDAAAEPEAPAAIQEVIVTGSRIPVSADLTATSPLSVVSRDEIKQQGRTDITDLMNQMPQAFINSGTDLGNNSNPLGAAGGIATVDLRGLGPQRTLVLVDGKRLGNGDPNTLNPNPAADLDQIPAAMVERIDVVTGGASAVYGSDAMAGVVNFIMRKNFQGVEIDGQYGFNQHSNSNTFMQGVERAGGIDPPTGSTTNGYRRDMSIIAGMNSPDGDGNITGYFVYHHQDPTTGSLYDFADCLYVQGACANSGNSNRFTIGGNAYSVVGNQWLTYPQPGSVPPPKFNSSAYEFQQREDDRYQGGFLSHIDINKYFKPYLDFSFMDDRTTAKVAPSGLFEGGNPYTADNNYLVNCGNPFLSAQQLGIVQSTGACGAGSLPTDTFSINIGRRNVEGGGRSSLFDHTNYRIVGGANGDIIDGVTYDAYAQYYYTTLYSANGNFLSIAGAANALLVGGTAANPVCLSGGSCVPWNIFNQGGVTQAAVTSLYEPGTSYGTDTEKIQHVDITADLGTYGIKMPTANDGLAVNLGYEHRFEGLSYAPDQAELSGDLSGFSGAAPAISAGYAVNEGFLETRLPIAQNMPYIKDLDLDGGYRWSHYNTSAGTTNTYKLELQYAPVEDVRFRGSFDRAVRAPNLIELYNPQAYGQQSFVGTDPCVPATAGADPTATLAQCENTGMTAAQYNAKDVGIQCTGNQCGQVTGGNLHLKPEVAVTWSLGASFTPTFLPNFSATIDYFHIAITNEIGTIPGNVIFNNCLNTGNPAYCSQIVRNPITGALHGATVAGGGYILQTNINAGATLVSGIDLGANYRYPIDRWGTLVASLNGTWQQHNQLTPYPGAPTYDCAGLFGANCNNGVNPKWRHTMRVSWQTPWLVDISALWRYIGSSTFDNNSSNPILAGSEEGGPDPADNKLKAYNYLDLTLTGHPLNNLDVRVGVTNVFDKDPPLLSSEIVNGQQNNSFLAYDAIGRQVFVAFTAKF
jgi:outer membrane receptor protein involved in Fe transport